MMKKMLFALICLCVCTQMFKLQGIKNREIIMSILGSVRKWLIYVDLPNGTSSIHSLVLIKNIRFIEAWFMNRKSILFWCLVLWILTKPVNCHHAYSYRIVPSPLKFSSCYFEVNIYILSLTPGSHWAIFLS